jgi:hypothetical protein
MKSISKILFLALVVCIAFAACKKIDDAGQALPRYVSSTAVTLSSSAATIAVDRADSNTTAVTFNWSDAGIAADSAHTKYVLQIDTAGGDFTSAFSKEVIGNRSIALTAKELNAILIGFGLKPGNAYTINTRVVSSYVNNNDLHVSNVVTIQATPYLVPPKVVPPSTGTLVLVGSATASGWDNPVGQGQHFTMIDSVTYEGTFFMNGGGEYLMLPLNGNWDHKYNVADKTVPGLKNGGVFGLDQGGDNIPGPDATGMYKIAVDFQNGKYTVTKMSDFGLLYVPGDYQGWSPSTAQTLGSAANDGSFDGYVNIPSGGTYEFKFTATPDWSSAFGDAGSGMLDPGGPSNLTVPAGGYYHFTANTTANTWSSQATTWSLIGSFAASTWSNDVPMTYDAGADKWVGAITTVAGDQFKFRANNDWALNYGDNGIAC